MRDTLSSCGFNQSKMILLIWSVVMSNQTSAFSIFGLLHTPMSSFMCSRIARASLLGNSRQPHNQNNNKKVLFGYFCEPNLESKVDCKSPGQLGSLFSQYTRLVSSRPSNLTLKGYLRKFKLSRRVPPNFH